MDTLTVAAVTWKLRPQQTLDAFLDHLTTLVTEAADAGAGLIVLPECIDLERLDLALPVADGVRQLADDFPTVEETVAALSRNLGVTLVAGTHLRHVEGTLRNTALIAEPGMLRYQDKLVLTQYERTEWCLQPGAGLQTFLDGLVGVLVCYDSEFPVAGRSLAEAGALVHCVPTFTETDHGATRVRVAALARALENQVYVVQASLTGSLGEEPVPTTSGTSAVYAPPVVPFPASGVLAQAPAGEESVCIVELDFDALRAGRESDDVRNWADRDAGDFTVIAE